MASVSFHYETESFETEALEIEYCLVPWDTKLLGYPVAQIRTLDVRSLDQAVSDFHAFKLWLEDNQIRFCSCRIGHHAHKESHLLSLAGFEFIELNYQPELQLDGLKFNSNNQFDISVANLNERKLLTEMAFEVFQTGRFHNDPMLGSHMGNIRYRNWMHFSFEQPERVILKCEEDGEIVGFFVAEYPQSGYCHWSLVGLAPGKEGKSLGKRVWTAMLQWHQQQGIRRVSTSISSLNDPILNLYARLGFRFPTPKITLHWHADN